MSILWLQKHNDSRAHDIAHSADLWHQLWLAYLTWPWSWRLCGINPTTLCYGLEDQAITVWSLVKTKDLLSFQTDFGAHPPGFVLKESRGCFPRGKSDRGWWPSTSIYFQVKNEWSYISISHFYTWHAQIKPSLFKKCLIQLRHSTLLVCCEACKHL